MIVALIAIACGPLLVGLYVGLAVQAMRTGVRLGQLAGDVRQTRAHAPWLFWGTIVLFGVVMVRSGVAFVGYGLELLLAS